MNPITDAVEKRASRAAESILENESLTGDLDDVSAKALLDWGVACAKTIAQSTARLEDPEAEQVMSTKLGATRRLMRSINRWIGKRQEGTAEDPTSTLDRIIEQVPVIYGEAPLSSVEELRDALSKLLVESAHNPPQMIAGLRSLIESPVTAQPPAPSEAKVRPEATIPPAYRRFVPQSIRQQRARRVPPAAQRRILREQEERQEHKVPSAAQRRIQELRERREEIEALRADWHRGPEDTEKREESESPHIARRRILEAKEKREELEASRAIRPRTRKDKEESGEQEH
jgi:hypothetical protein